MSKTIHQGRNIRRFRELFGLKQEALAWELGEDWSQKRVSILEQKEVIDQEILDKVAEILKVPAEAIRNFDEDMAIAYFNTFNDHSTSHVIGNQGTYNFNPIDKWFEALEENKQLIEENKKLYERLLQSEREKVEILQKVLDRG